jgi:hypothetical protein
MSERLPAKRPQSSGEFFRSTSEDGQTRIPVCYDAKPVWLAQAQLTELFRTTKQNVSLCVNNMMEEQELRARSVVKG